MADAVTDPHADVLRLLGTPRLAKAGADLSLEIRNAVRKGLPFAALEALRSLLELSMAELTTVLGIPERTLARRKEARRFAPAESDRLYRVVRALAEAQAVLGTLEKAVAWLKRPNQVLRGEAPLSLLDTDIGARQVEEALLRVSYGIYS